MDDQKLYFGTQLDSYIEYNEDQDDYMVISGSGNALKYLVQQSKSPAH